MNAKIKLGFIGGGNMATALIEGILKKRLLKSSQIGIHEPDLERAKTLKKKFKILLFSSNTQLTAASPVLLLAIKPQQVAVVLDEIKSHMRPEQLLLSILAGIDTETFYRKLPRNTRLIRIMPNLCAQIGEGASALFASKATTAADRSLALKLFKAVGTALFVEKEETLDAVTAVSGSGPAFVYLFIQGLLEAATLNGLSENVARKLLFQTLVGATHMVENSQDPIPEMIERVTSKGGTTEAGLRILHEMNFKEMLQKTITAATERAKELRCISWDF